MRGWLAEIRRARSVADQVVPYDRLLSLFQSHLEWRVLPFDRAAALLFQEFRKNKIRVATMDLKIAAVAIAHGALLLSANAKDFRKVPSLQVEDWLHT